jgi:isopenicillin N synthase-like dioxygenase
MLRCPPKAIGSHQTNLLGHTDLGSVTMLFNVLGGLQILPSECENVDANWRYIRPEPGCAIINLADAMTLWTGGILRSNIHRVATAPGQQAACTRYSVAYLVRPEANASMRRLDSSVIPPPAEGVDEEILCARDWEAMRAAQVMVGKGLSKKTVRGWDDIQKREGLIATAPR